MPHRPSCSPSAPGMLHQPSLATASAIGSLNDCSSPLHRLVCQRTDRLVLKWNHPSLHRRYQSSPSRPVANGESRVQSPLLSTPSAAACGERSLHLRRCLLQTPRYRNHTFGEQERPQIQPLKLSKRTLCRRDSTDSLKFTAQCGLVHAQEIHNRRSSSSFKRRSSRKDLNDVTTSVNALAYLNYTTQHGRIDTNSKYIPFCDPDRGTTCLAH